MTTPRLILPSELRQAGEDPTKLAKLHRKGELVRVRRGVYAKSVDWSMLPPLQKYGLQAAAFQALAPRQPVFCHASAALLWGLWIVGTPTRLHVVTDVTTSGRTSNGVVRHVGSLAEGITQCGPFLLTDKLTTTMALISKFSFPYAVAVCDSSLRPPETRHAVNQFTSADSLRSLHEPSWATDGPQGPALLADDLRAAAEQLPSKAARQRTLTVINFASPLSGSAGESLSRAKMHQFGFPAPQLQRRFTLRDSSDAFVDFWFAEQNLAGEFDGMGKYLRSDWGGGKSIQERVMAEKSREDQIRSYGVRFVRWAWDDMMNHDRFSYLLRQAGLPQKWPRP